MTELNKILNNLKSFFDQRATLYGAEFQSVDWNSLERQQAIFNQLLKIWINPKDLSSVLDFGCGYGALLDYMSRKNFNLNNYFGYDISQIMIENALKTHNQQSNVFFSTDAKYLCKSDYVIASGIISMKMDSADTEWEKYIFKTLTQLWELSKKGLAFNSLTIYSDQEKMRPDLYYADPCRVFDFCKKHFSKNVALLHDYDLYEFTILVRK
jgi:SAM-dependent methyltransferase